jgi:hypothetical protein
VTNDQIKYRDARVPKDWLDGASGDGPASASDQPFVRLASTLDYDGATNQLTLTRGDGTLQQFPAANNPQRNSGGRWPDGTFSYERHTSHPDDAPDSGYGSNGNYIFTVPGRDKMGVHSGRMDRPDRAGRSGVNHATLGCIRTTDEGTAAIRDAMTSGDPVTRITVRNNR